MRFRPVCVLALCPVVLHSGVAHALPVLQEMALHSMLETTTSVFSTLRDYALENPDGLSNGNALTGPGGIAWSGTYGDSGWSYQGSGVLGGMVLSMSYSGTLAGTLGSDITITTHGTGSLSSGAGTLPLLMTGQSTWLFDAVRGDYLDMDFEQLTKIGSATRYGWVRGKEKIICLVDGVPVGNGVLPPVIAGENITLTSTASSGKKLAYGSGFGWVTGVDTTTCRFLPVELFAVASLGKRGSMTISTTVVNLLTSTGQPAPAFPLAPAGDPLAPENLGTLITDDGHLYADESYNLFRSTGQVDELTFSFSGTTTSVPAPATGWLLGLALACGLAAGRSRRVGQAGWQRSMLG